LTICLSTNHIRFPYTTLFRSKNTARIRLPAVFFKIFFSALSLQSSQAGNQNGTVYRFGHLGGHIRHVHFPQVASAVRRTKPDHRSEEHTSELQSRENLVCRLL